MKLIIDGEVPSLKNQKQIYINKRTGKPFITSSKNSKVWQATAVDQLRDQFKGLKVVDYPINVAMEFYYSTKRSKDLDNSCFAVLDAMVHSGVIEDDDFKHVDNISISFGGFDKENPRVLIYIDD